MNPGTDIGKKELPSNLRSKFIEIFVEDITAKTDLELIVQNKINSIASHE